MLFVTNITQAWCEIWSNRWTKRAISFWISLLMLKKETKTWQFRICHLIYSGFASYGSLALRLLILIDFKLVFEGNFTSQPFYTKSFITFMQIQIEFLIICGKSPSRAWVATRKTKKAFFCVFHRWWSKHFAPVLSQRGCVQLFEGKIMSQTQFLISLLKLEEKCYIYHKCKM